MLDLILIDTLAIDDPHVGTFLTLFGNTDIYPHFEAGLLLTLFIEQNFNFVNSIGFLVVNVEMVKIVDLINFRKVVRDYQAFANVLLV
jgi:hypothetical protein